MDRRRRSVAFFGLAASVHAVLLASLRSPRHEHPTPVESIADADTNLILEPPEESPRPATSPGSHGAEPVREATRLAVARRFPEGPARPALPVPSEATAPDSQEPWTFWPSQTRAVNLGSDSVAKAARAIVEETPRRSGGSTTGGVAEGLDAHDAAVGLGRSGPLLASLESATEGTDAPAEGTATFDVAVDARGHVSVTLLDASSDGPGWMAVGEVARNAVEPARVRLPPGGSGWRAVVRIEARAQYPNGVDPKRLGTKLSASPTGLNFTTAGKVCRFSATLGIAYVGLGGGCDFANLGTHPLRVVHGNVLSEGRL